MSARANSCKEMSKSEPINPPLLGFDKGESAQTANVASKNSLDEVHRGQADTFFRSNEPPSKRFANDIAPINKLNI